MRGRITVGISCSILTLFIYLCTASHPGSSELILFKINLSPISCLRTSFLYLFMCFLMFFVPLLLQSSFYKYGTLLNVASFAKSLYHAISSRDINYPPVGSGCRALDCRARSEGFKPQTRPTLKSLNINDENGLPLLRLPQIFRLSSLFE